MCIVGTPGQPGRDFWTPCHRTTRKASGCVLLGCSEIIAAATIHDVEAKTVVQTSVPGRFRNRTSGSCAVHVVTGLQALPSQEEMYDMLIDLHPVQ